MEINYDSQTSLTWGLRCLDKRFGRPGKRELIIVFGYASAGKTEFTYFVARKNGELNNKVLYVSLELPEYDMKLRICRKRAGVSKINFQELKYTEQQKYIMDKAWEEIENNHNVTITSPVDKSLGTILNLLRAYYDEGYRMFVIDNLDKIRSEEREDENRRYQRITSTLQDEKNGADMCILLVHHASKPDKKNPYGRAGIGGLRGNQKIVDNATQVLEVGRDQDPYASDEERARVEITQMKDTFEGANGSVDIYFVSGDYEDRTMQAVTDTSTGDPF